MEVNPSGNPSGNPSEKYYFSARSRRTVTDVAPSDESNLGSRGVSPDPISVQEQSHPGLSSGERPDHNSEHHDAEAILVPVAPRYHLDTFSASALIINKMIGNGIFATPFVVLAATQNKGVSLMLWIVGCLVTIAGQYVYLEYGIRWPVTGGELIYIHNVYRKPPFLFTYIFGTVFIVLGGTQANALSFGKEVIIASSLSSNTVDSRLQKFFAIVIITFVCQLQAFSRIMNVRMNNMLAIFKICLLSFVAVAGLVALAGVRTKAAADASDTPYGVANMQNLFDGSASSPYAYSLALLNIMGAFLGYENANFVLDEVQKPPTDRMRTFRRALKLSVGTVCFLYLMINVAFFAACTKEEIIRSPETLALFFEKVFGPSRSSRRASAIVLALTAAGNVMALTFGYVRVKQEIARLGCVVYPEFFARTSAHGTPAGALLLHWIFSCLLVIVCPLDRADGFITISTIYPYAHTWISILLGGGLLAAPWLSAFRHVDGRPWTPQSSRLRYWLLVPLVICFIAGNVFVLILSWWPADVQATLGSTQLAVPSYAGPIAGTAILAAGLAYWFWDVKLLPSLGYSFHTDQTTDESTKVVHVTYTRYLTGPASAIFDICQPTTEKIIKFVRGD